MTLNLEPEGDGDDLASRLTRAVMAQYFSPAPPTAPPAVNRASVHFGYDSLIGIGIGALALIAMAVTVTASACAVIGTMVVCGVWGWSIESKRQQDVERMSEIRAQVMELRQYKDQLLRRVGALENQTCSAVQK